MDGLGWEDGAHNQRTPCFTLTPPLPSHTLRGSFWLVVVIYSYFLNPIEIKL